MTDDHDATHAHMLKKSSTWIVLGLITILGMFLRSLPSFQYSVWGNDFGIYYAITTAFVSSHNLFSSYNAIWGISGYGNFPMFYWIILFLHIVTGLSVKFLLLHFTPILGGLTVPILYFISKKLFTSRAIALLAALFLAINPIDIYQTSMVGLLVAGHVFLLLSILFFIYSREYKIFYVMLTLSTLALILSHHLSTYMYILSISGIIFWSRWKNDHYQHFKLEIIYLFSLSFSSFVFWIVRTPAMEKFMSGAFGGYLQWYEVILLFYAMITLLFFISEFLRHHNFDISKKLSYLKDFHLFLSALTLVIIVFVLSITIGFKGIKVSYISILYSIPFVITLGFIGVGLRKLQYYNTAYTTLLGWPLFLTVGLSFSIITVNGVLFPYRYLEYIFEPLSIIAAVGVYSIYKNIITHEKKILHQIEKINVDGSNYLSTIIDGGNINYFPHTIVQEARAGSHGVYHSTHVPHIVLVENKKIKNKNLKIVLITFFTVLLMLSTVTSYPFMDSMDHSKQGISPVMMSGIIWLEQHGNKNYTIATDHINGLYLEACGFNSSFEYDYKLWNASTWTDAIYELYGDRAPYPYNLTYPYPPIEYVLINSNMYEYGVYGYKIAINPYTPPILMNNSTFDKFLSAPFQVVFYNSSFDNTQWVYVFQVNWTYIDNYVLKSSL